MNPSREREIYPWKDVLASREDEALQASVSLEEATLHFAKSAHACPECATPADRLAWFYFRSPDSTWKWLCGIAGWMTVCDWCERQVDFFPTAIN